MQIASIVCPVDFSEHSERALEWAMALASSCGAHLTLLTANDPLIDAAAQASGTATELHGQTQDDLRALLERIMPVDRWPSASLPAVSVVVGEPADVILIQAGECAADVIVMGTQGLGGVRRFVFGSTTERVLRRARIPVLAVPAGPRRVSTGPSGPALDLGCVLAPVDIGQPHVRAIEVAGAMAERCRVPVRLLAVIPAPAARDARRDGVPGLQAARVEAARGALAGLSAHVGGAVPVESGVRVGRAGDAIAEDAAERGCGLVVMGSGVRHRPGATVYRVLCQTEVPVLAVPPPD